MAYTILPKTENIAKDIINATLVFITNPATTQITNKDVLTIMHFFFIRTRNLSC